MFCCCWWAALILQLPLLGTLTVYVEERGTQRKMLSTNTMQGEAWHYSNFSVEVQDEWRVRPNQVAVGIPQSRASRRDPSPLACSMGSCPHDFVECLDWQTITTVTALPPEIVV